MNDDNNTPTKMQVMKMCIQEILRQWRDARVSSCRLLRRCLATAVRQCKPPGFALGCGLLRPEVGDATHHVFFFFPGAQNSPKRLFQHGCAHRLLLPCLAEDVGRVEKGLS